MNRDGASGRGVSASSCPVSGKRDWHTASVSVKRGDLMEKNELSQFMRLAKKLLKEKAGQESEPKGDSETRKPAYKFQCGNVAASVFHKEVGKDGVCYATHNITIDKVYKDKDGEWRSTNVFRPSDMHKVITVAQRAFEIAKMDSQANGDSHE